MLYFINIPTSSISGDNFQDPRHPIKVTGVKRDVLLVGCHKNGCLSKAGPGQLISAVF